MPYRLYRVDFPDAPSIYVVATAPEPIATTLNIQGAHKIERLYDNVQVIPATPAPVTAGEFWTTGAKQISPAPRRPASKPRNGAPIVAAPASPQWRNSPSSQLPMGTTVLDAEETGGSKPAGLLQLLTWIVAAFGFAACCYMLWSLVG
jgi:hypothetical protein